MLLIYSSVYYSTNSVRYARIIAVVKHLDFYYVFTTIDGFNLPYFALFCLFCD